MKTIFAISDVHGFYQPLIDALDEAGFDRNNPDHWLIGCGDYVDRGRQPGQVLHFLSELPRKVLVRGNHEDLLVKCCLRTQPTHNDYSNGTAQTIIDIGGGHNGFDADCKITLDAVSPIFDSMVDYFETENYVFTHSAIPEAKDWRNAPHTDWEDARWPNPFKMATMGILPAPKTLVFGHWHTSAARHLFHNRPEYGKDADFSIYYSKRFIGIDGCTALTGKCNVLVVEDEFLNT